MLLVKGEALKGGKSLSEGLAMYPQVFPKLYVNMVRAGELSGAHGAPVHKGDPARIGIQDLDKPDFSGQVTVNPGEVPVFWACGVTSSLAVTAAKLDLVITHAPGHMFVSDLRDEHMAIF